MEKEQKAMEKYRLARHSVQMIDATLVEFHINKNSSLEDKETNTKFQFLYRVDKSDKGVKGRMVSKVVLLDLETEEILVESQITYEGTFQDKNNKLTQKEIEEFTKDQVVPQLLPYCRSLLAMISSQLGGETIELPTMDVIDSIIRNSQNREKSDL